MDELSAAAARGRGQHFGWAAVLEKRLRRNPRRAWRIGFLLFAVVWLAMLGLTSKTAPFDNIEQLTWVRSLELGYYKHPPLPTWLLWPVVQVVGLQSLSTYLMGALLTLGSLGLLGRLLVDMRGWRFASLSLLGALCITFYNGRLYYYNHNTVLFLFAVGSAWASWHAFSKRSLAWWAVVGVMLGLGGLSKYQIAISGASVLALWLHQRGWRDAVHLAGGFVVIVTMALVMSPHLIWLVQNNFPPIHYAMASSLGVDIPASQRLGLVSHWLLDLLFNRALPAWLLLALALAGKNWRGRHGLQLVTAKMGQHSPTRLSRALLLSFGLVPLVLMPAMGLWAGVDLQLQWGTAFAAFVVPAVLELLLMAGAPLSDAVLRRALVAFLGLQLLLLSINFVTSPQGPRHFQKDHWCRFDSAGLARLIGKEVRSVTADPIGIIDGPANLAGSLALQLPEHPRVLIDGDRTISPWVSADAMRLCLRLQVDTATGPHDLSWTAAGPAFPDIYWRLLEPPDDHMPCPG